MPVQQRSPFRSYWKLLAAFLVVLILGVAVVQQRVRARSSPNASAQVGARPRAVFGELPNPAVTTEAADGGSRSRAVVEERSNILGEVEEFIEEWRSTWQHRRLDRHVALYAPRLDRFFRERNVPRKDVRREKAKMLKAYRRFDKYAVSDIKIERILPGRVAISFRKDWDARGLRRFAGSELEALVLSNASGSWQIISEEERRVFWVRR